MTEKEKMLAGKLYFSGTEDLIAERMRARKLCYEYNHKIAPDDREGQQKLLKELLGKTGEGLFIEAPFICDYGSYIEAGKNLYMNFGCTILDCAKVKFGDNVMLAPNVGIYTAGHPLDVQTRHFDLLEFAKEINIGNNVWIGANAVILGGVTIGDNAVIGAGSVVTKDIPENALAVGNPCKVVKIIDQNERWQEK